MEGPNVRFDGLLIRRARAGRFAEERYRRGLESYRRRMRTPLLVTVVPMYLIFLWVVFTHKLDLLSVMATVFAASASILVVWVRDDPPQHVLKWRLGAEGERKTEKVLRRLERDGWKVDHDIERKGSANIDHIVRAPNGKTFLLETKNLLGTVTFENGVLQARQFDDPDEVYRYYLLAKRVRGQAAYLSGTIREESGRRTWVEGVVVLWGLFEQGVVEHERVTYVAGDRLVDWLQQHAAA